MKHYTDYIRLNDKKGVALLKGWFGNFPVYAYVLMDQEGYRSACLAYDAEKLADFEEFGEVLVSGEGHVPSPQVEHFIRQYIERFNLQSTA